MRKPRIKKSLKARTTGKEKRQIKKPLFPDMKKRYKIYLNEYYVR